MTTGRRSHQVADLLREELAILIQGLRDPRVGFVTVTAVRLSPDLKNARVLISVLDQNGGNPETLEGLGRAAGWLRRELARRTYLKHVPQLSFEVDDSIRRGARIEALLSGAEPEDE